MNRFLAQFVITSRMHVTEEDLLGFMDGEIRAGAARRVRQHLEACWACRSRYEEMQGTIFQFMNYRKQIAIPYMPPSTGGRARFMASLDDLIERKPISRSERLLNHARLTVAHVMNPILSACLIVVAAALAIVLVWRHTPTVSANELLEKAEMSELQPPQKHGHVAVYQKVRIRTQALTLERALYRDSEGRRHTRTSTLNGSETELKNSLELVGVDWQRPLSASDYRRWHDRLTDKRDEVHMAKGLLTLSTITTSSDVSEASLTVRMTDFHTLGRRMVLRKFGAIEISEVGYELLTWDQIDPAGLFEPADGSSNPIQVAPQQIKAPAPLPTTVALDEAEIRARLALNQANADSGEQIVIRQSPSAVQISGVVETNVRKEELENSLRGIPLVTLSLKSVEEMVRSVPARRPSNSRMHEFSITTHESPLQTYLEQRSATPEQAAELGSELLEAVLTIQKESHSLNLLNQRFPGDVRGRLSSEGRNLLGELLGRHRKTLKRAIAAERILIASWVPTTQTEPFPKVVQTTDEELERESAKNKELCDEVLAASKETQRPVDRILSDMQQLLDRLEKLAANLDPLSTEDIP
jgi:hypothetical protein